MFVGHHNPRYRRSTRDKHGHRQTYDSTIYIETGMCPNRTLSNSDFDENLTFSPVLSVPYKLSSLKLT